MKSAMSWYLLRSGTFGRISFFTGLLTPVGTTLMWLHWGRGGEGWGGQGRGGEGRITMKRSVFMKLA